MATLLESFLTLVIAGLVYHILSGPHTKSLEHSSDSATRKSPSLYINVILVDASSSVEEKVNEKLEASIGRGYLRNKLINKVSQKAVSKMAKNPEIITTKIAENFLEAMPPKLKEMGIEVDLRKAYISGPFLVLKLDILHVSAEALIEAKKGSEAALKLKGLLSYTPQALAVLLEDHWLPDLLSHKLQEVVTEKILEKTKEKGVELEMEICREENEAHYFFNHMTTKE
eukprot:CAMPEP_0172588154 /NCGR_PEP_ID=MMETSP1068-20121228/7101_1 /TAXON_ID=35684 /ORGANISM="Pseudopedinella elastica, Strain CCMP716" /LENGTH=227 /DNA_ID=CAMNT_0013383397 /DNA_START=88 /DNA_END=771 /DNA_ORIENTATION=-